MSYLGRALVQEMTFVKDLAKQLTVAASKLNGAMTTSITLDDRVREQNKRFNHAINVFLIKAKPDLSC